MSGEGGGSSWLADQIGRPYRLALIVVVAGALALGASVGVRGVGRFRAGVAAIVASGTGSGCWSRLRARRSPTSGTRWPIARSRGQNGSGDRCSASGGACRNGYWRVRSGRRLRARSCSTGAGWLTERDARERVLGLGALEYAVLAPATALAALWIIVRGQPVGESLTLPWLIGVPVGGVLALTALRHKQVFNHRGWRRHIYDWLRSLGLLLGLFKRPGGGAVAFLGIGCYWLGDVFCLWATLHGFSARTPPIAALLVGYATGYALTRRALPLVGPASSRRCSRSLWAGWRSPRASAVRRGQLPADQPVAADDPSPRRSSLAQPSAARPPGAGAAEGLTPFEKASRPNPNRRRTTGSATTAGIRGSQRLKNLYVKTPRIAPLNGAPAATSVNGISTSTIPAPASGSVLRVST